LFTNDFGICGGKCLSRAQKITLNPRKLLKWHLGSCYWLLVAINYNYTSLSHWWNFRIYNICFIHFTWNNIHKNAFPWPSFKSWTYAWHYWHPPNIGMRYIHQTSKPKVSLFQLNKFPSSLLCSHNWQMPRTNLFQSYPWIAFTSIFTKPEEKLHVYM